MQNSKCYHIELKKKYTKEYIDNDIIDFSYGLSDSISQINSEGVHYEEFDLDDGTHIYYLRSDGEKPSTMQWASADNTTMFTLAAPLSKEEMVKIIQNILIVSDSN